MLRLLKFHQAKVLATLVIFASGLFFTQVAQAGQCNRVKLKITNSFKSGDKGKKIKVRKIIYYNDTDNRWRKDPVNKTEISYGDKETITEGLEGSENEFITKIQVVFQEKKNGGWSDEYWCSNVNKNFVNECNDDRTYVLEVTGTSSCKGS